MTLRIPYMGWLVSPTLVPEDMHTPAASSIITWLYGSSVTVSSPVIEAVGHQLYKWRKPLVMCAVAGGVVGLMASGPSRAIGVSVTASALVGLGLSKARQVVPDEVEACVADMVGAGESTTIGGIPAVQLLSEGNRTLTKSAVEWTQRAKLHFGVLQDTTADRICARRWLAEEMKKADMRDRDACGLIPVVVEMLLIPTVDDIFAQKIRHSRVAKAMHALHGPQIA